MALLFNSFNISSLVSYMYLQVLGRDIFWVVLLFVQVTLNHLKRYHDFQRWLFCVWTSEFTSIWRKSKSAPLFHILWNHPHEWRYPLQLYLLLTFRSSQHVHAYLILPLFSILSSFKQTLLLIKLQRKDIYNQYSRSPFISFAFSTINLCFFIFSYIQFLFF